MKRKINPGEAVYTDPDGVTHEAVGERAVPTDPDTLLLWTRCIDRDIPANAAVVANKAAPAVDCPNCLERMEERR